MPDFGRLLTAAFPEPKREAKRNGFKVSPMKQRAKPINQRAKVGRKRKLSKLVYRDSFGVSFADSRLWLPERTRDWPAQRPFKLLPNNAVCSFAHRQFDGEAIVRCWLCGEAFIGLEAHHVVSRYDFIGNICMCCTGCHQRVQHNESALPEVLRACWKNNKLYFSWVFLVRARGSWWGFDSLD